MPLALFVKETLEFVMTARRQQEMGLVSISTKPLNALSLTELLIGNSQVSDFEGLSCHES